MAESEQIREFIAKLVEEHWSETGKAILLSQLGPRVRVAFPDSRFLMPKGLLKFLQGWPVVQVIRHPQIPEKIGAVPLGANLPESTIALFKESHAPAGPMQPQPTIEGISEIKDSPGKVESSRRSYLPDFWRAFHVPIDGKRFVIFPKSNGGRPEIVESASEVKPDEPSYEITQSDVASSPGTIPERVQATAKRIEAWLNRNSLSYEPFLAAPAPRFSSPTLAKRSFAGGEPERLIAAAFLRLDPSELARISVPLDIVFKMLTSAKE